MGLTHQGWLLMWDVLYRPSFASWRYAMKRFALIALLAAVAGGGFLIRKRGKQDA